MRGLASPHPILGASRCDPVLVGFVVDNSGSARLVLLVTSNLPRFPPFSSSGPRCATSWLVWTRRTECCCSSTSPLYLTVTCSVFVLPRCTGLWTLLGDDFRNGFRISSVRQWYMFGVILRLLLEECHIFYVKGDPEVYSRPGAHKEIWTLFL